MKGEGLIDILRRTFKNKPFTKYDARTVYYANSKYINEIFEQWIKLGILKPDRKCECKPAYRLDPNTEGELWCSIDDEPFDESICPILARLAECAVISGPNSECTRLLDLVKDILRRTSRIQRT